MGEEVYADLYVLINLGMDLIALMITAAILHRRGRKWRLLVAAGLGGFYALAALLWSPGGVLSLVCDLSVAFLLSAVAFAERGRGIGAWLRAGLVYLLTSMILGGVMTVLYEWLGRLDLPLEALGGDGISVWIFSALAAFAGLVTARGGRLLGRAKRTSTVGIKARLFGREVEFLALTDTGNFLRDPISGRGVIVVEERCLRGILPAAYFSSATEEERLEWMRKQNNAAYIRAVPARTAGGETLLWAAVPELLEVSAGKECFAADYLIAPARLGREGETAVAVIGWD